MGKINANKDLDEFAKAAKLCACANFRKASRAITRLFNQALEPSGLRSTQLIILLEIAAAGSVTVPQLSKELITDRSTLARSLRPLTKKGLLKVVSTEGRRSQSLTLTPGGLKTLKAAVPLWERAQAQFVQGLGQKRWLMLLTNLPTAVTAARG